MKTTTNKTRNRIIQGALLILGLCIAIPFCYGMYDGYTSHTGTTGAIEKALEEECNCKTIDFDHSAYGLQFSREEGVTGETAAFILKDCQGTATAHEETERFNKKFLEEIEGYAALDIIQFQFKDGEYNEVIIVKKGIVQ